MNMLLLRRLIRETLLHEAKFQYPGGDSIHGVFAFWRFFIRSDFEEINGRWPTYGEYVDIFQSAIPGFVYTYGNNETPDTSFESVFAREPGGKFLDRIYRQLVAFIGDDDRKDLKVCRSIERVGNALSREAKETRKRKRDAEAAAERQRAEEYAANYEPTAPEGAPLGRYAFSPQRQGSMRPPPPERNLPAESALLRSIISHFEGRRPLTRQQSDLVMSFIRDGLYPDVFREPPPGTYYRGMLLAIEDLTAMGISIPRMEIGETLDIENDFTMMPQGNRFSSSWSSDIEVADRFSRGNLGQSAHDVYSVIFAAGSQENPGKFIDAEGLYDLDMEEGDYFAAEKEVIGLGPINANRVRLVRLA
jgi:hypothetical protein